MTHNYFMHPVVRLNCVCTRAHPTYRIALLSEDPKLRLIALATPGPGTPFSAPAFGRRNQPAQILAYVAWPICIVCKDKSSVCDLR